jgi:hypothetical protein
MSPKIRNIFFCPNAEIIGSNPTREIDIRIYQRFFLFVLYYVSCDLETG